MLAVVLSSAVVTYGGVSVFVAFFVLVPMAQALFKIADLPKRLMPAAIALGTLAAPPLFRLAARLDGGGVLVALALSFAFMMAWAAAQVGLAPIVGAYAAGLLLEPLHCAGFSARGMGRELGGLGGIGLPIRVGLRDGIVVLADPPSCKIMHEKASVAVLSDERDAHL